MHGLRRLGDIFLQKRLEPVSSQALSTMKILRRDIEQRNKAGSMELVTEHQDDVYTLSSIIRPGDIATSSTTRKIQLDSRTQQKISLSMRIKIETVTVDLETSVIYLKGRTTELHEHIKLGSYHTLDIPLGQKFKLHKEEWPASSIREIVECAKSQPEMVFTIFYEKECVVSVVSQNRINVVMKQEIRSRRFGDIIKTLEKDLGEIQLYVIASMHDIRNEFYKAASASQVLKRKLGMFCVVKVPPECKGCSNAKVINTILTDRELSRAFKGIQYVDDLRELDGFFVLFAKGSDLVRVGRREVDEAMDYGAVEKLMITDELYRPHNVEARREIEEFCREARKMGCKICVIPVAHFLGGRLKELGGLCATLKFSF
jgi:protein pelota